MKHLLDPYGMKPRPLWYETSMKVKTVCEYEMNTEGYEMIDVV